MYVCIYELRLPALFKINTYAYTYKMYNILVIQKMWIWF